MATLLDDPLVDDTLASLPGWNRGEGDLWREVHLPKEADAELRREIDADAAAMDHSVTIEKVRGGTRFSLRTEDVGGVSELDIALASRISDVAHRLAEESGADEPGVHAVRRDEPDTVVEADSAAPPVTDGLGALLGKR